MNLTPTPFPSDRKTTLVEIFYLRGDPIFICGIHGSVSGDTLEQIEADAQENWEEAHSDEGTYLFEATYVSAQVDEYGRVELPAYYDLNQVGYRPIDDTLNQH